MDFYKSEQDIYNGMADRVKDDISVDEKSFFYTSNKPVAFELSNLTIGMDEIKKIMTAQSCANNQYSEYLTEHCKAQGVDRKIAKYATGKLKVTGRENSTLPAESLVSTIEGIVFITQEPLTIDSTGIGYVNIIAKEAGSKYNVEANTLTVMPIKYSGIISVTNEEEIKNGYDEENDYELLERYLFKVRSTITSGNSNHYILFASEVDGVGKVKVFETTNESGQHQAGHVLVIITDSNQRKAEQELIDACYNHIEEERPVNAKVHVISANEVPINISTEIFFNETNYTLEELKNKIEENLVNYLKTKAFSDNNSNESTYISYNKLGSIIANTEGIDDYDNLLVNGSTSKVVIKNIEIPVLGTLDITKGVI